MEIETGTAAAAQDKQQADTTTEETKTTRKDPEQSAADPRDEKRYSDNEVDEIIKRKIAKERKRLEKLVNEEQTESELEKRERKLQVRELRADAREKLAQGGYSPEVADLLDYTDEETMTASMEKLTGIIDETVSKALKLQAEARARGTTPRQYGDSGPGSDPMRKVFGL